MPTEWDEADLACRIREAGWKVATCGYERLGGYEHLGSSTLGTLSDAYKARVLKNGLLFHQRWSHLSPAITRGRGARGAGRPLAAGWLRTLTKAAGRAADEPLVVTSATPMLKAVRNAAASAAAWTLYHAPVLERPYAYAAHAALTVPGVHTVFREATDRLVARLAREHRADRRVEIGSVSPVFDVSSFTVKGRYFARVTYEPGATDAVLTTLGEGDVFVDIGANSGYFTVLAALRVGARGRVFAFEPNPAVRRQLAASRRAQRDRGPGHRVGPGACRRRQRRRAAVRVVLAGERRHRVARRRRQRRWPAAVFAPTRRFPSASGRSIRGPRRPGRRASI